MGRYSGESYLESLYQPKTIKVGDKVVDIKEYKKQQRIATKKKHKKTFTSITILPSEIRMMMRNVRVLKSLVAYYEHGYRQWGTIAKMIMGLYEIKQPFNNVVINTKQAIHLINQINDIAKDNSKDVFQFVKKLSWKLEDVKNQLDILVKGINSSGVIHQFRDHECINGNGKRLGLQILVCRGYKAIDELSVISAKLDNIEKNGMDIFEYHFNGKQVKI